MGEIVKKYRPEGDSRALLCQLVVLGTYVKRRCNLRLIEKDSGRVSGEDLCLSFQDMVSALKLVGTDASLTWESGCDFGAEFSIYAFDMFEHLLETACFSAKRAVIEAENGAVCLRLSDCSEPFSPKADEPSPPEGFRTEQSRIDGGFCVRMTEGNGDV